MFEDQISHPLSDNPTIVAIFFTTLGGNFSLEWPEDEYEDALEYCKTQLDHWTIDSITLQGTNTIPTVELCKPKVKS